MWGRRFLTRPTVGPSTRGKPTLWERRARGGSATIRKPARPFSGGWVYPRSRDAVTFTAAKRYDFRDQAGDYAGLADELRGLRSGERDLVANAANMSALLFDALPDLNWAGFYFLKRGELV